MMRYSVQSRNRIFVKDYGFVSFVENMGKNIAKSPSKNLDGKYSQKLLDHLNNLQQMYLLNYSSKRVFQKTAEAIGDLTDIKIANKMTKTSKTSQQNNSERVTNEYDAEIPKEGYISSEKRQKIIDHLRLI